MAHRLKKWLCNPYVKKVAGILLLVGGVFGLVLPFLQGVLMIIAGLTLLGNKHAKKYAEKLKAWVQQKRTGS